MQNMKNIISTLVITTIFLTSAFASLTPEANIISNEVATVTGLEILSAASFDSESESFEFQTLTDITLVQIFDNEGNMEFQLPVMSNFVKLNKNIFSSGDYQLGFILEGDSNVHLTTVTIK